MMNKKFLITISLAASALLLSGIMVSKTHAENALGVSTNAQAKVETHGTTQLATLIAKGNADIDKRIASLSALSGRVAALKNVSSDQKAFLSGQIQVNISGLTALKAKINADTDVTVATTDDKNVFGSFRIYALVIPQGYIIASTDRVATITGLLNTVGAKLQTRINDAHAAGKDTASIQATFNDMNEKIVDANSHATLAHSTVISLTPDQGDKARLASNTAALKAARANTKIATSDLETARKDAKAIVKAIEAMKIKASI